MASTVFKELKRLGMEEDAALALSSQADVRHLATREDVLVLQESILQVKLDTESSIQKHRDETREMKVSIDRRMSDLEHTMREQRSECLGEIRSMRYELKEQVTGMQAELRNEIHTSINRQFIVTFGGLLTTIITVVAVNWYFH